MFRCRIKDLYISTVTETTTLMGNGRGEKMDSRSHPDKEKDVSGTKKE